MKEVAFKNQLAELFEFIYLFLANIKEFARMSA